ncbi:MAG TPA: TonB-dependent receptor, partial [Saprospiraceae bacterium]|nr:TonB-dependent receptor [Saprospiraceae bacterium]
MMKRLLLLLVLVIVGTVGYAQTTLSGKVTEEGTSNPADLATVRIFKGGALITGTTTEADGSYNISNIDPGTYSVDVSYVGFNPQRIDGVVVKAGKANFLNIQLSKGIDIKEVIISDYKVPLIEQDNTTQGKTITAADIKNLPQKNINAIVGSAAGVSTSGKNGEDITIRGSRKTSTVFYLDGVPVSGSFVPTWDLEQLQVITGGLGAEYGDVTGGVISGSTKGPSNKFGGGIEGETSQGLDPYGYNLLNVNFSGPIIKNKTTNQSILGYRVSGSYNGFKDNNPSAVGIYTANSDVINKISADPITQLGPGFYVSTGELLKKEEVSLSKTRPNEASQNYDFTGRLDYKINPNMDISLSGTYHYEHSRFAPDNTWWLINSQNNPEMVKDRYRVNFRFRHRLGKAFDDSGEDSKEQLSTFRNASYTLQFFYQNGTESTYDIHHTDNFFDYGYVGKFSYDYVAKIDSIVDQVGVIIGAKQVDNKKTFVGYDPSNTKNPGLAAYNKLVTDPNSYEAYIQRNGEAQETYNTVWSFHDNINQIYNRYNKQQTDRKTFQGTMSFDFLPNGSKSGRHNIQIGLFYEERITRNYTILPNDLWKAARGLQNIQILGVDTNNITNVKLNYINPQTGDTILVDSLGIKIDL